MNPATVLLLTLAAAGVAGVAAWAWNRVAQAVDELRSFDVFDGMHFER